MISLVATFKNPRVGFVTVTDVEVSGDLQQATVYILGSRNDKKRSRNVNWPIRRRKDLSVLKWEADSAFEKHLEIFFELMNQSIMGIELNITKYRRSKR